MWRRSAPSLPSLCLPLCLALTLPLACGGDDGEDAAPDAAVDGGAGLDSSSVDAARDARPVDAAADAAPDAPPGPPALAFEVTWDTPGDPDPTDPVGADLDLHVRREGGAWNDPDTDCHEANPGPDWGPLGPPGDPELELLDEDGAGPERIAIREPEDGRRYDVAAAYVDDAAFGPSLVTLRVFAAGAQVLELKNQRLQEGQFWHVFAITWHRDARLEHEVIDSVTTGPP